MYSVFAKNTSGIHGNTYRIHVFQEYIENTKNTKRYYMYSVFILIENTPKSNRKHPQSRSMGEVTGSSTAARSIMMACSMSMATWLDGPDGDAL
jgi:hypothetical protein